MSVDERIRACARQDSGAYLESDDRRERVCVLGTAALEGQVRLSRHDYAGARHRGVVGDGRLVHAFDLPLETSRAAEWLVLQAVGARRGSVWRWRWRQLWSRRRRTKSSSKQGKQVAGDVGSHVTTSGSTDGAAG